MVEGSACGYDISLEVQCNRFYATVVAMVTTPLSGVHIPSFTYGPNVLNILLSSYL